MTEYVISKNVANMMKEANSSSALDSQVIAGTVVSVKKWENDYAYIETPALS
jgi:SH3-like domain-containing protein